MPKLSVVFCSTREHRAGKPIADWFVGAAKSHGNFDVTFIDLMELNLPVLNEPNHPRKQQYTHQYTKDWAAQVKASDAFVFVVPEYNFAMPPALLNALDYLYVEWNYKAAAVVSYGGLSGGLRSMEMVRQVLPNLKVVPLTESVCVPFFTKQIADGKFTPNDAQAQSVAPLLDELAKWTNALASMRS